MTILHSYRLTAAALMLFTAGTAFGQAGSATDQPISGSQKGVNKDWQPSRTNDGAYDKVSRVTVPIPWQHIREDDILWKKRVWREIDTREKQIRDAS